MRKPPDLVVYLIQERAELVQPPAAVPRKITGDFGHAQINRRQQLARLVVQRVCDALRFFFQPLVEVAQSRFGLPAVGDVAGDPLQTGCATVLVVDDARVDFERNTPPIAGDDFQIGRASCRERV